MRPTPRFLVLTLMVLAALFGGCTHDSPLTRPDAPAGSLVDKGIPAGYYDAVNTTTGAALRASVHATIDDHTKIPYTSTGTDTWIVVEAADTDPANSGRVLDVYLNASFPKYGAGNLDYNREHVWCKSFGFPNDGASNYPYTDCHHLFICNDSYNSARNNKPYGTVGGTATEYPTQLVGGIGGGSGVYPGWSNWSNTTLWETWWDRRGDVARALLYMDVRYEGGTHGATGYAEPDLILSDNLAQIEGSNTGANLSVAYMGLRATVLQWHLDDPVDDKERARNDAVYSYQGNRNPFVDHPEWVACIFVDNCGGGTGDTTPPSAPTGLLATAGTGVINLDWNDNTEADLAGYTVYRATAAAGPYAALNGALLAASTYADAAVTGGTTYWYVVTADDQTGNESAQSTSASATAAGGGGGGGTVVWINEFHYDNDGTDTGELVEVCGAAGTSLAGWSVVGYNGSGGAVYATVALSGTLPNQSSGFGTASFAFAAMQNGSPDGLALVNASGTVVQFLSYEGTFTGVGGAANGMVATDVGVSEGTTSPVGWTLQLAGSGTTSGAFTWQPAAAGTAGLVNTGQSFGAPPPNTAPVAEANGPYAALTNAAITFSSTGSTDSDGTITGWLWNFGDGATSTLASPSHAYAAGGAYTATLTVTDNGGAQASDTSPVTITAPNVAPVAQANGPYSGMRGANIAFSSAGSTDSDGTITAWLWNFGDGATSTLANPTHAYATAGSYTATLTVTDNSGAQGSDTSPVTVTAPALANVWINEFHYDNAGTDASEFVEVAGPAGTSLTGWTVVGYNGANGAVYATKSLSGTIANKQNGFGVVSITFAGLENGAPDGLALVNASGQVVQFLSYEGAFTATGGAASGMTSVNIPVSESEATVKGNSLQLRGTGDTYAEFTWYANVKASAGVKNTSQTFATVIALMP
jgi:endonuclease I/PKD repeat protein